MNSRGQFIIEGIKQAGRSYAMLLVLGLIGAGIAHFIEASGGAYGIFKAIIQTAAVVTAFVTGILTVGPWPSLLIHFDISNGKLVILSLVLGIPYWLGLGALSGLLGWSPLPDRTSDEPPPSRQLLARQIRHRTEMIALAITVLFCFYNYQLMLGNNGHGDTRRSRIILNLLLFREAKLQYASGHQVSGDFIPNFTDLSPYLPRNAVNNPEYPVRYVINSITNSPYAILTNDWWVPRHGWEQGHYLGTNGQIFRLPPAK